MNIQKFIPSTEKGKTWALHTYKGRDGCVCAYAVEGVRTGHAFEYTMYEAREVRVVTTEKRMTKKAADYAFEKLEASLRNDGKI